MTRIVVCMAEEECIEGVVRTLVDRGLDSTELAVVYPRSGQGVDVRGLELASGEGEVLLSVRCLDADSYLRVTDVMQAAGARWHSKQAAIDTPSR